MFNNYSVYSLIIYFLTLQSCCVPTKSYSYKEFPYKDNPKNEMTFHEFEMACEQSSACISLTGLIKIKCVRECVSPSCYKEIYQNDQLEDGEIDVRLNSFKGCFIQRTGRTRN